MSWKPFNNLATEHLEERLMLTVFGPGWPCQAGCICCHSQQPQGCAGGPVGCPELPLLWSRQRGADWRDRCCQPGAVLWRSQQLVKARAKYPQWKAKQVLKMNKRGCKKECKNFVKKSETEVCCHGRLVSLMHCHLVAFALSSCFFFYMRVLLFTHARMAYFKVVRLAMNVCCAVYLKTKCTLTAAIDACVDFSQDINASLLGHGNRQWCRNQRADVPSTWLLFERGKERGTLRWLHPKDVFIHSGKPPELWNIIILYYYIVIHSYYIIFWLLFMHSSEEMALHRLLSSKQLLCVFCTLLLYLLCTLYVHFMMSTATATTMVECGFIALPHSENGLMYRCTTNCLLDVLQIPRIWNPPLLPHQHCL